jgi:hypothetical protein
MPSIALDSHIDFSPLDAVIVFCIFVNSLAKIEDVTMPELEEMEP